jgi:outer membrane receptor protein involved in Fe transport
MSLNNNRNLFEGNPDLNPSLVHSYEFGYSLQKNKFSITPTLYYRNTVDDIKMYQERTLDANNNTVITTKPINLGTEQTYGLDLNASVDITKWWKVMGNLDLFGYKTEGKFQGIDYSGDGFSSRVRLTNTFRPDKNTSFQIQSFFRGGQKTASNEQKAMYAVSLGANRTIWKGNGTLSFNVQDIFNTRARETAFTTETYTNSSYMQMMPRTFTVSLSYRFKQGEKVESQKRKKDINNNDNGGDDQMPPM